MGKRLSNTTLMEHINTNRRQRIIEAIIETEALITKESAYRPDLQKAGYVASLESHRATLVKALDPGMKFCVRCGSFVEGHDTLHDVYHHEN